MTNGDFAKLRDELEDVIGRYTCHLANEGIIKEEKIRMSNGFDVIFRDRKRSRIVKSKENKP